MSRPLGAASRPLGRVFARRAVIMALVLCAAGVPMLPTNEMKVAGTLLAGVVLLVGAYLVVRTGGPVGRTALDLPVLVFWLLAVLSTALGVHPLVSTVPNATRGEGLLDYFVYLPMALAAARLSQLEAREILAVLLGAGGLIGAAAVGQYYGVDATRWIGSRGLDYGIHSWGTLANPDFLGGYAALVLPIGVALAAAAPARGQRWGGAGAGILLYAALLASQTRSAWAAAAAAAAVLLVRLPRSPRVYLRLALLGVAFAAVTAIMIVTQPRVSLGTRAQSAFNPADSSMQGKFWIWEHVLPMIRQRPVLGWGFSAVLGNLPGIGTPSYRRVFGDGPVFIDIAHNDILQVAVNMGLLGLGAYLWIWAVAIRAASAAAGAADAAGILAGLTGYFIWLQFLWSHIGNANVFWVLAGLTVALQRAAANHHGGIAVPPA